MNMKLSEVYAFFKKDFAGPDVKLRGVSIDSRSVKRGDLFFAIKGENRDGHEFIGSALNKGAVAAVSEKDTASSRVITVKDTKTAMLKLGHYYMAKSEAAFKAAVTGSSGKTTVKEICAAFLGRKFKTVKNEKSYNNYAGFPLTLFKMERNTGSLIAEIGMNHAGEIASLVKGAGFDAAAINNTGTAHIGNLGSEKNIALAKAEIIQGLKKDGVLVLNSAGKYTDMISKMHKGSVRTFGTAGKEDFAAKNIALKPDGSEFEINGVRFKSGLSGMHNVENVLCAAAIASEAGVSLKECASALKGFRMKGMMRFESCKAGGYTVINDAYNANPDSFKAAVESLKLMDMKMLYVVTGEMRELGKLASAAHTELGRQLADINMEGLFCFGGFRECVMRGYLKSGGDAPVYLHDDIEKMAAEIKAKAPRGAVLFFKGSRGNRLEDAVKQLAVKR